MRLNLNNAKSRTEAGRATLPPMEAAIDNGNLILKIPLRKEKDVTVSKTGKTYVLASTGFRETTAIVETEDGPLPVSITATAMIPKKSDD